MINARPNAPKLNHLASAQEYRILRIAIKVLGSRLVAENRPKLAGKLLLLYVGCICRENKVVTLICSKIANF